MTSTIDRLAGEPGHRLLDRHIEVILKEQSLGSGAAPSGNRRDALVLFKQHQVRRKAGELGFVVTLENVGDEGFGAGAVGRADDRVPDRHHTVTGLQVAPDGAQHGCSLKTRWFSA
jgi:hypothetical protein